MGAGDEKDKSDGAEQNEEGRLNVANYLFVEREYNGARPRIVIWILLRKARSAYRTSCKAASII